jgi:hypothetical protein
MKKQVNVITKEQKNKMFNIVSEEEEVKNDGFQSSLS